MGDKFFKNEEHLFWNLFCRAANAFIYIKKALELYRMENASSDLFLKKESF